MAAAALADASLTAVAPGLVYGQTPLRRKTIPGAPDGVLAFVNVNVVPMDSERVLRRQTVLVRDGRITVLGAANQVRVPTGALQVEGAGKYLIPGLADMHVHMTGDPEQQLLQWLASGVTTTRHMQSGDLRLRARAAAGEIWSPRIYAAPGWISDGWERNLDSAAALIAGYKMAGYDHLKIYHPSAVVFDSMAAIARRVGIPIVGHVPPEVSIVRALAAGIASIEHLSGYFPAGAKNSSEPLVALPADTSLAGIRALAEATKRAGVWNTPTLAVTEAAAKLAAKFPSAESAKISLVLELMNRYVKALQDAGAGLLLGTDATSVGLQPTSAVPRELELLVAAGLTPYQALLTGTRNVAQFYGTLEESGTVTVGKRADLVLLTGNPLENVGNIRSPAGVMIGGRWLSRAELDRRLSSIKTGRASP